MPLVNRELLAVLPRLRRYAQFLIDDPVRAEAMVEETIARIRQAHYETLPERTSTVRFLSVLRGVYVDRFAPGRAGGPLPAAKAPLPNVAAAPIQATVHATAQAMAPRSPAPGANDFLAQFFELPLEQREVLVLVAVERLSYEETAALLAVPVATVFARLVQARHALHDAAAERAATPKTRG